MFAYHTGIFTGEECPQDTPGADTEPPPPAPTEDEEEQDCGPTERVEDAEGRIHLINKCTTTTTNRDNQGCAARGGSIGTIKGVQACIEQQKGPKTTETKKEETKTETKNPDGSKKNENTTTTTKTECKGGVCTTTTTTTNNSTKTNADGSPGGSSSNCKGDKCPGTGTGGNGGGGGGSSGNGDQGDEETPKSSVGGEACDAAVTCTGDAVQCAILRQQKTAQCDAAKFREVTPKKEAELKTSIETEFSGEKYSPIKADADSTFTLDGMIDTSSRFSKVCPAIPEFSFPSIDGQSISVSMTWVADWCQYLVWIGYLIVAFGMRRAAEIIAGGMN
jgi:hypothetical protein